MSKAVCNTSPIQYLFQLGLLDLLNHLADEVILPGAVVQEIEIGRVMGSAYQTYRLWIGSQFKNLKALVSCF